MGSMIKMLGRSKQTMKNNPNGKYFTFHDDKKNRFINYLYDTICLLKKNKDVNTEVKND